MRCQAYAKSVPIVRHHLHRYLRAYRYRVEVRRLTPYLGPHGTRWAIPYRIVACESRGSWSAYNRSGAVGAY